MLPEMFLLAALSQAAPTAPTVGESAPLPSAALATVLDKDCEKIWDDWQEAMDEVDRLHALAMLAYQDVVTACPHLPAACSIALDNYDTAAAAVDAASEVSLDLCYQYEKCTGWDFPCWPGDPLPLSANSPAEVARGLLSTPKNVLPLRLSGLLIP